MAALKKKASIIGAGPLIVSDTLLLGAKQVESRKQLFLSSTVQTDTPLSPTLP